MFKLLTKNFAGVKGMRSLGIFVARLFCVSLVSFLLLQCDYWEEQRQKRFARHRATLESEAAILNLTNEEKLWCYTANFDSYGVAEILPLSSNPAMEMCFKYETLSPLTYSLRYMAPNDVAMVLIEHGVPLTSGAGREEVSALHRAAHLGKEGVVELLLRKGAKVNSFNYSEPVRGEEKDAFTPLMLACDSVVRQSDKVELFGTPWLLEKTLLKYGADINIRTPELKRTALHRAVFNFYTDTCYIDFLCESGADVNAQDKWGMSPYMYCMLYDRTAVASTMKKYGVKHHLRSIHGYTAEEMGCLHCGGDFPEEATPAFKAFVKLRRLCASEDGFNIAEANAIYSVLSDINAKDATGRCLLHVAVEQRNVEAVRWLLSKGADPNILSDGPARYLNDSALAVACKCDDEATLLAMIKLLVEAGAEVKSAFTRNQYYYMKSLKAYLYLASAAKNMSSDDWNRCLYRAGEDLKMEGFEQLLDYVITTTGFDINTPDSEGYTLLLRWCEHEENYYGAHIMKLLLQYGADAKATLPDGRNGIMLACSRKERRYEGDVVDKISLLSSAGCPADAVDANGNSAVVYLLNSNRIEMYVLSACKELARLGAFRERPGYDPASMSALLRQWGVRALIYTIQIDAPDIKSFMRYYKEIADIIQ